MIKRILGLGVAVGFSLMSSASVWYVDKDNSSGDEDGRSWGTAFSTIQPAIDAAFEDGGGEVWVAEGVYDEERQSIMDIDLRPDSENWVDTGSIVMAAGVHLYGGFIGSEMERSDRDWELRQSVLEGSTSCAGGPAIHVVAGADDATLDGFTVSGGNAKIFGGATGGGGGVGGGLYSGGGVSNYDKLYVFS